MGLMSWCGWLSIVAALMATAAAISSIICHVVRKRAQQLFELTLAQHDQTVKNYEARLFLRDETIEDLRDQLKAYD